MKLLVKESEEIKKILEGRSGIRDSYSLFKRKAWVYIQVEDVTFAFHRKTSSMLKNGQFIKHLQYFVKIETQKKTVKDFSSVLLELTNWLDKLD